MFQDPVPVKNPKTDPVPAGPENNKFLDIISSMSRKSRNIIDGPLRPSEPVHLPKIKFTNLILRDGGWCAPQKFYQIHN